MNTLKNIKIMISNTLYKEFRSKTLIFLSILTIAAILLLKTLINFIGSEAVMGNFMEQAGGMAISGIFTIVGIWSYFLSVFLAVNTTRSDIESNAMIIFLSFPLKRIEYLVGRSLGVWLIISLFYLVINIFSYLLFSSLSNISLEMLNIIPFFLLNLLSYLVIIFLAQFISLYFSKLTALTSTMIFAMFLKGSNSYYFNKELSEAMEGMSLLEGISLMGHMFLPRVGNLNTLGNALFFEQEINFNYGVESIHFVLSFLFLVYIFNFIFKKRQI